jgi:cobalt-zinc-cadmium efflux system outer membrane protein
MRRLVCASVMFAMTGCHALYTNVDSRVEQRAAHPIDVLPTHLDPAQPTQTLLEHPSDKAAPRVGLGSPEGPDNLMQAAAQTKQPEPGKSMLQLLTANEKLLGWKVPDIVLPPPGDPNREKAFAKYFPPLPAMPTLPEAKPAPHGRAYSLSDLQQIALRMNPLIRQAHQDIEAMRGAALQAGLYPNPSVGYEASTIGQGDNNGNRSPGQQGGYIEQTIILAGKLTLAREAALRDVQISEQKLKETEADLQAQVRAGYFAVLSAQKNFESTKALAELTDQLYNVLLLQMKAGEVAAYEPMQIRVLSMQARGALVQAHNRYVASWKQLAATLGTPGAPLTTLEGRIDMPVPHFDHDQVLRYVLANHTDIASAQFGVEKARLQARLAEVQPFPDVTVQVGLQKDYTAPPFGAVANVNVGVPIPFWNRNQGNIQTARAQLGRALQENARVQNDLTSKVAEAFQRYENNRVLLAMYKDTILPNQVQAFRAAVARHAAVGDKGVSYFDLVNSQQTLASLIRDYLGALNDQWTSVVDIAHLMQSRDLFQTQPMDAVAPIPDVYELYRERHRLRH